MSDWLSAGPAIAVALAAVILPGAVVGWLLHLRSVALLALAGPLSVAIGGASAVLASALSVPFTVAAPLALTALLALGAWLIARRDPVAAEPPGPRWVPLAALAAVAAATVGIAFVAFGGVGSPGLLSQTYDGVFHLNAVARVLETGDGSSFTLYRMTNPGDDLEFYPAAWHDLVALVVQLTGASIPTATNAMWIAVNGFVYAAGVAYLAGTLFPNLRRRGVEAVAAAVAGASSAAPYLLLQWGTLYPTGLAYALLPSGLALAVALFRRRSAALPPAAGRIILLLAAWSIAGALAHPRSLVTFAVLVTPLVIQTAMGWTVRGLRDESTRRRTLIAAVGIGVVLMAAAAAAATALLAYFRVADRPISDRLNGGPATARQTAGESVLQALLLAPPAGPGESTLAPSVVVATLVLAGLVLCVWRREHRWLAVAYGLLCVLYVLAAASNSDFAKLATGLWYKDKFRIFAGLGVLVPALVALTLGTVIDRIFARLPGGRRVAFVAAGLLTAAAIAGSWLSPGLAGMRAAIADVFAVTEEKDGRLVDREEIQLLVNLTDLVPAGERVVGNPWNGSVLSWVLADREPLFPHFAGYWDTDRQLVLAALDQAATRPDVCDALNRLRVTHLFASAGLLWNGDPQAAQFAAIDRAAGAPGFTLVAQWGDSALYRIDACAS